MVHVFSFRYLTSSDRCSLSAIKSPGSPRSMSDFCEDEEEDDRRYILQHSYDDRPTNHITGHKPLTSPPTCEICSTTPLVVVSSNGFCSKYPISLQNASEYVSCGFLQSGRMGETLFIYSQSSGTHTQAGIYGAVAIEDFSRGLIKKHENTISVRAADDIEINNVFKDKVIIVIFIIIHIIVIFIIINIISNIIIDIISNIIIDSNIRNILYIRYILSR
jgi:hypothetical protein